MVMVWSLVWLSLCTRNHAVVHAYALLSGIRPNGASYLLLPVDRFDARFGQRPRDRPRSAHDFESLSPIQFGSKEAIVDKLSTYVSNKKNRDGHPRDRSKANTEYTSGGDGLSDRGEERSCFEHQRYAHSFVVCEVN